MYVTRKSKQGGEVRGSSLHAFHDMNRTSRIIIGRAGEDISRERRRRTASTLNHKVGVGINKAKSTHVPTGLAVLIND